MSVIRWLVMQEVCLGLNLPAILNFIWPGHHPLLYTHANTTTSDEHSIVTMLHSTRIIFSTYSYNGPSISVIISLLHVCTSSFPQLPIPTHLHMQSSRISNCNSCGQPLTTRPSPGTTRPSPGTRPSRH